MAGNVDHGVIIVGAGISGLCMAMNLKRAGRRDFIVLEEAAELGGTWQANNYPGCESDVPAHLYSFSFARHAGWPRRYGSQPEILDYLRRCAHQSGILPHISFNTTVVAAVFERDAARWVVETESGYRYHASALVLAVGVLHRPVNPDIPGLRDFAGPLFHSSGWNHDCELAGRNVAVIGTGASAIQIVPAVAPLAGRLMLFQRTAPWVLPRRDATYGPAVRALFRNAGLLALLYRWWLFWRAEWKVLAFRRHRWLMRIVLVSAHRHLRRQVPDAGMRGLLTPSYAIGCKRLLLSNTYYPALGRENVELVTTPITRMDARSIVTDDGRIRRIDVVILATGFHVVDSLDQIRITGKDGISLHDAWKRRPEAFLGVCVAGFPNLFLMVGPNSGLAHTSMFLMIEGQARYIAHALNRLGRGIRTLEVKPAVQRRFNTDLQRQLRHAVWSVGGCQSWFLDATGRNRVLWPGSTASYRLRTLRTSSREFDIE